MSIRVLFVCHGNICRSTMAQSVLTHIVKQKGIADQFFIESAATSREEIGNPPHYSTVNKLKKEGITIVPHKAVQMKKEDYSKYDYIIGMDSANIRNINKITCGDSELKIYKLLDFVDEKRDVADPWYTGDFDATYRDVNAGCYGFIKKLKKG